MLNIIEKSFIGSQVRGLRRVAFNYVIWLYYFAIWVHLSPELRELQSWPKILGQHFKTNKLLILPPLPLFKLRVFGQFFALRMTANIIWHGGMKQRWWRRGKGKERVIFCLSSFVRLVGSHLQRCPSHYWPGLIIYSILWLYYIIDYLIWLSNLILYSIHLLQDLWFLKVNWRKNLQQVPTSSWLWSLLPISAQFDFLQ